MKKKSSFTIFDTTPCLQATNADLDITAFTPDYLLKAVDMHNWENDSWVITEQLASLRFLDL